MEVELMKNGRRRNKKWIINGRNMNEWTNEIWNKNARRMKQNKRMHEEWKKKNEEWTNVGMNRKTNQKTNDATKKQINDSTNERW